MKSCLRRQHTREQGDEEPLYQHYLLLLFSNASMLSRIGNGHTTSIAPRSVRSGKSSGVGPDQCYGGGRRWKPWCCSLFFGPDFAVALTVSVDSHVRIGKSQVETECKSCSTNITQRYMSCLRCSCDTSNVSLGGGGSGQKVLRKRNASAEMQDELKEANKAAD